MKKILSLAMSTIIFSSNFSFANEINAEKIEYFLNGKTIIKNEKDLLTRAEAVKIIIDSLGIKTEGKKNIFLDVSDDHWANEYIKVAYDEGYISGYKNLFRPDEKITFIEWIAMLTKSHKNYDDSEKLLWQDGYLNFAYKNKIIDAIPKNKAVSNENVSLKTAKETLTVENKKEIASSTSSNSVKPKFAGRGSSVAPESLEENKDEIINIPDEKLKKVINKNIDKNRIGTEDIKKSEIENLKHLSIALDENGKSAFKSDATEFILELKNLKDTPDFKFAYTRGIKNLEGLQYAINLEKLDLSGNEISDLSQLSNLTKLTYLDLHRNRISDLKPIENLINLEFLDVYNNLIENVEPVSKLVNLKHLDVHYNVTVKGDVNNKIVSKGIKDVSSLSSLKKLNLINLSDNLIENVDIINDIDTLKYIDFVNNKVSDYTNISEKIANTLSKMFMGEEEYSMMFAGQNVDYSGSAVVVDAREVVIDSDYKGIKVLNTHLRDTFGDEEINAFGNIISSLEGVDAVFDENTEKITLSFTDEFLRDNNDKEVTLNLKVAFDDYIWNYKNINLKVEYDDGTVVSEEDYEFYYNLFTNYSRFDRKYKNLTDEANSRFSASVKPKQKGEPFTKEDMQMLKTFVVTNESVDNSLLKPLKYATNLEEFKVELSSKDYKREATNFRFLKNLPNLKIFYYLQQDPDALSLGKENAPEIDFSKNTNLKDVRINNTTMDSLEFLSSLDLTTLSVQDNLIEDISPISNMVNLTRLDFDNNKISDLGTALNNKVNLVTLYLRDNPITDISALSNLSSLEALHLRNTKVDDISILTNIPKLFRLYLDKETNLNQDYFENIKKLSNINTLFIDEITLDDFNWLKESVIRPAGDEATYGEDKVRMYNFTKLVIPVTINRADIVDSSVMIDNPLKDWDDMFIQQSDDEKYGLNSNITFSEGDFSKIKIDNIGTDSEFMVEYSIFIENYEHLFGDYGGQPASLSGRVILKITVEQ